MILFLKLELGPRNFVNEYMADFLERFFFLSFSITLRSSVKKMKSYAAFLSNSVTLHSSAYFPGENDILK